MRAFDDVPFHTTFSTLAVALTSVVATGCASPRSPEGPTEPQAHPEPASAARSTPVCPATPEECVRIADECDGPPELPRAFYDDACKRGGLKVEPQVDTSSDQS
jgi:hypothetical protein